MKISLVCVSSQNVVTFRRNLIEHLQKNGFDVSVIAFDDEYRKEVEEMGVKLYCVNDNNRSKNPLKILTLKKKYKKIFEIEKPDIVFTFMLKPNVFGALAASSAGVKKVFSMVEGAGDMFANDSLKWKIVRKVVCVLYKKAFKKVDRVFFLNNDDLNEFVKRKLLGKEKCEIIHGIGVDLERFDFREVKNYNKFLMVARMIETKGVLDYCKTARAVKEKYPEAEFGYLGGEGNVKLADIQEYVDDGSLNYLGTTKDVRPYLEDCSAFVLPSYYREGLPMSIMEAESMGRAVITCDNVGCRETVTDGYNGYLVEKRNVEKLIDACVKLIENPNLVVEMGRNSRNFAEENFDQEKINGKLIETILG